MYKVLPIIAGILFGVHVHAQPPVDKGLELRAGYMASNFYDRSHAGVRLHANGYSFAGTFRWGKSNINAASFTYGYFPSFEFKGNSMGRSMHTFFGYDFVRGKPFLNIGSVSLRYGAHIGGTTAYRDFEILVNNRYIAFFSVQAGPLLQISGLLHSKGDNFVRLNYSLILPVAAYSMVNVFGKHQKPKYGFIYFGRRTFLDSDVSVTVKSGIFPFKVGYRWLFEDIRMGDVSSIYGLHNFYIAFTL